jgi:hypothetical protein
MAKRARKTRRKAARRQATASRRTTTRRLPSSRTRTMASTRSAQSRGLRSPGDTLRVTFDLRDVSNRPIRDPETYFTFRRVSDRRQIGDQIAMELTGAASAFELPAATGEIVICEIDARRFRFAHSPVFFRSPGPPITKQARLLREPKEWTPRFTKWNSLPSSFAHLKEVLGDSPSVTLFNDAEEALPERLVEHDYDRLTGEAVLLAKAALLNTHYRLNATREPVAGSRTWFSFVSRLVSIGRERLLAFVEADMETLVRQIHAHIDEFPDYERTPAENHRRNVPAALERRITSMISIKSSHANGNFQLTLTHLSGPDEVLLDADIDESGELLAHFFDLFKHKVTGGTHPHDIHDLLVLQDWELPGFDLGYRLT